MRHSRRGVAALVVVLVVFALVGAETRGAIPGADNPKAYTHHDHVKGKCEFDRRTLAGVYKAMGKRDAKWDAAAEKFLETMAVYFSYGFADPLYRGKMEMPTHEGALAEAKAAVDAGCDDPLVLYCRAAVMDDSGQHVQAAPLIGALGLIGENSCRRKPGVRREHQQRVRRSPRATGNSSATRWTTGFTNRREARSSPGCTPRSLPRDCALWRSSVARS